MSAGPRRNPLAHPTGPRSLFALPWLLIAVMASNARAQDDAEEFFPPGERPEVSVEVTPSGPVEVGDTVDVSLRVRGKAGDRISLPEEQTFAPFDLLATVAGQSETQDDERTYRATLLALEPGAHELALELRVLRGNEVRLTPVPTIRIEVRSLIENEPNAEPRAETSPHQILEDDYSLLWIVGILASFVVLAVSGFYLGRRWMQRSRAQRPPPPPRPPWEIAVEKLELLRMRLLGNPEHVDKVRFADELSDTVREYLGRRYGFDGLESTTEEVIRELKKRRPRGATVQEVTALLGDLDLVKFAKAAPSVEQGTHQLDCGYRIVSMTRPETFPNDRPPEQREPPKAPNVEENPPIPAEGDADTSDPPADHDVERSEERAS